MIKFENVFKVYPPDTVALDNIDLQIKQGEFVSLVGQSGAGKTTILRLLTGEEKPSKGKVFVFGENVGELRHTYLPRIRQNIGMVYQDTKLLPNKTALENIAFAMEVVGRPSEEINKEAPQLLDLMGLSSRADFFPRQLAGGEKQRVAIARALAHQPKMLIADEPTGNLDLLNTWDIIQLLMKINEFGTTVILATHDKDIVNNLKRRVITMDKGRVVRDQKIKGKYIL